jgi:hypothetical protein
MFFTASLGLKKFQRYNSAWILLCLSGKVRGYVKPAFPKGFSFQKSKLVGLMLKTSDFGIYVITRLATPAC